MNKKKESKVVPNVRFKGFTDDWKQRKLGELAFFNPKEEIPDVFEYVDLESVVGIEMLSHRTEEKATAPSRAQRLAHTGDLFYQTVRPYQKNNYLFEKSEKHYVFSTGYAQLRPLVDGYFLLSLVQNGQFVKTVLDNCTGTSYTAINANDLAEIEVFYSKDEHEHHQIGEYFRHLDNLITLHQQKLTLLTKLKKAMLEKMFPKKGSVIPEIRFNGFANAWEQRKLGDLTTYRNGTGHEEKQSDVGKYELVNLNSISIDGGLKPSGKFIDEETETLIKDDLVMVLSDVGHGDLLGRVAIIPENNRFVLNQRVALLRNNGFADTKYLFSYINAHQRYFKLQGAGSSQLNISRGSVENFEVLLPKRDEQKQIGECFSNLDHLITLHQRKIDMLKKLKSACLSEMFI